MELEQNQMEQNDKGVRLDVSSNQKSLWFLYKLAPESSAYNMYFSTLLGGREQHAIDINLLEQSYYHTIEHHDALKTGYQQDEKGVYAFLAAHKSADFSVEKHSFTETEKDDWIAKCADLPFELEQGYVCRANVLINDTNGKVTPYLIVTLHHIAGDFYSIEQMVATWAKYYSQLIDGTPGLAPSIQYSQWVTEQKQYLASDAAGKALAFWKSELAPLPAPLSISTDFERGDIQNFDGCELQFDGNQALTDKVTALARETKTTSYTVLLSAFQFYLHKLSGQSKFLIASPTMGRYTRTHKEIVGYCVNPFLIPADFTEPCNFTELIVERARFYRQSLRHQRMPLTEISESLIDNRSAERTAVTSHMFTYTRANDRIIGMPISDHIIDSGQRGAAHELNLVVYEYENSFRYHWRFNSSLYTAETVTAIADGFFELLDELLLAPNKSLILHQFKAWLPDAKPVTPRYETGLAMWQDIAPTQPALLYNEQVLTAAEINEQASRLAYTLSQSNVNHRDRVAILLPRGVEQVIAMLSVWYVGAAFVPLDDGQPNERTQIMLKEADVEVCVGAGSRPDWLPEIYHWLDATDVLAQVSQPLVKPLALCAEDLAYLIFTSGSTGIPKAVSVGHGALASYVEAVNRRLELPKNSVYASLASVATDLGYTALWAGLLSGNQVRILDQAFMLDAEGLADHLAKYPVDMLKVVPSHLQGLLASERREILPRHTLVFGGEEVNNSLLEQLRVYSSELNVFNHYGPTEATVGVIAGRLLAGEPTALGMPLDGCRVYLLDSLLQAVPVGAIGDLYIAGNQLAQGYWQDSAKTAQHFMSDPFYAGERMYRSGDRAKQLADGRIKFIGRADGQVKIRGYRVELAEIETQLNALDGVVEAAIVFDKTEGREKLTAVVVSKQDKTELSRLLLMSLPSYMQPHYWHSVAEIPRTVNGKVDRKKLALNLNGSTNESDLVPSLSSEQNVLFFCRLFAKVLNKQANEITSRDGFFAVGGDSILALQLVAIARKEGVKLTPQLLFKHQTPVELAEVMADQLPLSDPKEKLHEQAISALAQLWSMTLSKQNVESSDNFFEIGGDSILALQFIAAARKKNIVLRPQDVFKYQTLADLALFIVPQIEEHNASTEQISSTTVMKTEQSVSRYDLDILPETLTVEDVTANISARDLNTICQDIPASLIDDLLPLSPTQQGILFHCLLDPQPELYLNVTSMALTGSINADAFLAAWKSAAQRHDVTRSRFIWHDLEHPYQVVCRHTEMNTVMLDWQALSISEQNAKFEELVAEEHQIGFKLTDAPLMRVILVKLSPQDHRLIWTRHHLIVDGWTSALIAGDAMAIYQQKDLQPAPHYADYFSWLGRQDMAYAGKEWQAYLADFTQATHLPVPETPMQGQKHCQYQIAEPVTQKLKTQARAHGLTLNTLVQLAWGITLSRFTGGYDVIFGMTSAGRPQEVSDIEHMAGVFIASLPLRTRFNPAERLVDCATQLQLDASELRSIDYMPLAEIQSYVDLEPGELLFDTALVFQNYPFPQELRDMTTPKFDLLEVSESSNFPMMLQVEPSHILNINCSFDTQKVSQDLATSMLTMLDAALTYLSEGVDTYTYQLIDSLTLPTVVNETQVDLLAKWDLLEQVKLRANEDGESLALIADDRQLTYKELVAEVSELAGAMAGLNLNHEQPIAVCLTRETDLVVTLLAIYQLGLSYIPLDPLLPERRLEDIFNQAEPQLVIADRTFDSTSCLSPTELKKQSKGAGPVVDCHPNSLAYTIFTSGSTGRPKGVQIDRSALNYFLQAIQDAVNISAEDRLLAVTTIGFDIAVLELFLPLVHGATLVLANEQQSKDSQALSQLLSQHKISVMQATPATWQSLADIDSAWWSSLNVLTGGEALNAALAELLIKKAASVTNVYGPTEATVWASSSRVEHVTGKLAALGKPLINTQFYVLDSALQPVLSGVEGELYISGLGLARGYLNSPKLTAESFLPDPFSQVPGQRMYRTGDRVYFDSKGELQYIGRTDFQVKLRGFRIELGEIEAVLQAQTGVKEAIALVWQADTEHGYIAAYVTLRKSAVLDSELLLRLIAEHLPVYMVPTELVILDAMPLNSNGKIDRKSLPESDSHGMGQYLSPQTELEHQLVDIWQQILGHDQIGIQDSFFRLGGNSLSATRLQARIQRTFSVQIPLAELFHNPTISELATLLEKESLQQDDLAMMADLLDQFE